MILVEVLIENYKQYAGQHRVAVPSDATVGIIGANGVGKTTLFEAIEWCLYNPITIKNEQVRPRGIASHTRVAVTMDRPETGERFVVERTLKRAGVSAAIYRIDGDGAEAVLVQGTRQVSDYVSTRLIGLGHPAFVSTFFTRQKELSFFGHLGETDRRREVGRLLGLHTIRAAQESINDERKQAKAEADSLRRQYEDQSAGRDFPAELDAATAAIAAAESGVARATEALESAAAGLAEASRRRAHWEGLKDKDAALQRELVATEGKLDAVTERANFLSSELARLAERGAQRARLQPLAVKEPALTTALNELEARRERFQRHEQLQRELGRLAQARTSHVQDLRKLVVSVTLTERIDGWAWHDSDATSPNDAIARLRATLETVDLEAADARAEALLRCQEAEKAHAEASRKMARYLARRQEIDTEREELLREGDPHAALAENDSARTTAQAQLSDANAQATALEHERNQTGALLHNLQQSQFDDVCPTCARPFTRDDARIAIESLRDRQEVLSQRIKVARQAAKAAQRRQRELQSARQHHEKRAASYQALLGSLQASESYLLDQHAVLADAERVLTSALRNAGLSEPPADTIIVQATQRAALFRELRGKAEGLIQLEDRLRQEDTEYDTVSSTLAAFGEISYDAACHQQVADELRRARDAVAAIAEIEQEVARRPAIEAEIASARADINRLRAEHDALAQARTALGFDATALSQAVNDELAAQRAERTARDGCYAAQTTLRDAVLERDLLQETRDRVARLATRADCRTRDADQLDLMVREFNAFEKFVAGRYGPILAETTSTLVGQVTDGRYDRVEFDESYGIEVYDGEDEKFPLATFSGGERDAIALCARLALSRMVGSQAASPPGFLVLDEVFGSLDRDRRARLLDLLGSLAGATDHFHQLFVISHVDDVQGSAVFDELWRVVETAEGVSQIMNATRGDGATGIME